MALTREAGAELLLVINGSPYEEDKDDTRLELVRPSRGGRPAARWPTSTWSAARTSWSSTATRWSSTRPAPCWPAARSSARTCWWSTSTWPRARSTRPTRPRASSHVTLSDQPIAPYAAEPGPARPTAGPGRRGLRGAHPGPAATTCARTASARCCSASPAASTPPSWRRSRPTRSAGRTSSASPTRAATPASTPATTPRSSPPASAWTTGSSRSSRWSARSSTTSSCPGVAEENLQARVRALVWMGLSNQEGHLVLANSNKSELSVGYSTIYGDSVGGFAPIKDVPKTLVWELARWRNAEAVRRGETPPIPESTITKAPSAELRPGQVDQDSLPAVRRPRRDPRRLRRGRPGPRRAGRGRLRRGGRRQGRRPGRPGRVEAPPVRPRTQDLQPGVRPRPAPAGHQQVARAGLLSLRPPPSPARPCLPGAHHRDRAARAVRHRHRDPVPVPAAPRADPAPAGDEGARRAVGDAHRLRPVRRRDLRRRRHPRAAGRRLRRPTTSWATRRRSR